MSTRLHETLGRVQGVAMLPGEANSRGVPAEEISALEFHGDSVLSWTYAQLARTHLGGYGAGTLSTYKARLVGNDALAKYAETHFVGIFSGLSKNASARQKADAVEIFLGAVAKTISVGLAMALAKDIILEIDALSDKPIFKNVKGGTNAQA